jgi:hypothetical protein
VNGSDSVFSSVTATGGGAGATPGDGIAGGSGGGAGHGGGPGGAGTTGQGNKGGTGASAFNGAGGGGGAGNSGAVRSGNNGGAGGIGLSSAITGTATYYAGGGGGGARSDIGGSAGAGGSGGGGAGGNPGANGTANTGGGGGGGNYSGTGQAGGTGGSGIVIISYAVNTSSTYDSMTDVPTLTSATTANYCVMNPLAVSADTATFSNGNLTTTTPSGSSGAGNAYSTFAIPTSGKYYWEVTPSSVAAGGMIGISAYSPSDSKAWQNANSVFYYTDGSKYVDGTGSAYGASYVANDVIGVACNADSGTITFYKNNSSQGAITHAVSGLFAVFCDGSTLNSSAANWNFGQQPWTYTPPTGFVALNTYNI